METVILKIKSLKFHNLSKEIICINDGSTDQTLEILKKFSNDPNVKIITNKKNIGKSQSVRKGILLSKGDIAVVQDADLDTDPDDLVPMAKMIQENRADVVFGNRYDRGMSNKITFSNRFGNFILTSFSNLFTIFRGFKVPDMEVCYKMMRGEVFRNIALNMKTHSMIGLEPEITAKVSKYKLKGKKLIIKIYPIKFHPRPKKEARNRNVIKNGLKALIEIIQFNIFE